MKIVVFGGSGFLGSYVVDALLAEGHDVTVFDCVESSYLTDKRRMILGDILDEKKVNEATQEADGVYNFAGMADIDDCIKRPMDALKVNVMGNSIIIEACLNAHVKRYLFASTVYVYSSSGGFYRSTKQAAESLIEDYHKYYGLGFTILRYGTPYGPRADERNSVHRFLKQALDEGRITYRGDGSEVREYIHVSDAARLSTQLLSDQFCNERVALSGTHPLRITDLFTMINEILGGRIRVEYASEGSDLNDSHYRVTPYSYNPKIAKKLVDHYYLDLGQGLLDCIEEIHRRSLQGEKSR